MSGSARRSTTAVNTSFQHVTPRELLEPAADGRPAFMTGAFGRTPWVVRWDLVPESRRRGLVFDLVRDGLTHSTSGTSGTPRQWYRDTGQAWCEAELLAGLLGPDRPDAIMSFAPPEHSYGTWTSVLLGAELGVPSWYRTGHGPPIPGAAGSRWVVVTIPSAFGTMRRELDWFEGVQTAVLHSTAMLPAVADEVVARLGPDRCRLIELFGSTETATIALRQHGEPPGEWALLPDVRFTADVPRAGDEFRLHVRSPRLAREPGRPRPDSWLMDDWVRRTGPARFRFEGRRSRLVNVNGVRVDLDAVEARLRAAVPGVDLACVPTRDPVRGEHFELLVVSPPAVPYDRLAAAFERLGVCPRAIAPVAAIDRSSTGKVRSMQFGRPR
ncbi:acyl--CoA ligase [Actinosynnema sp. NPDC047251]|uniref:Acyl-CoA synthetase (AMP-forming)/AMP-acid ligase II n=1 Tax=Saccharothrix espanaensis (strain ATCC 51144 / DSM 44229 / JCM 9112 / NBRC 15066 / NRRL 15764) TaxID=1179773 RepID=K0K657_SACES|nr:acyl--CoA ligase [Saccharothrix espanaensis]CCH32374.1 Acyl-CoA synthetase (AMP-forming)/AMP-acid ligase II [Saccharothrix espanaensis DSM 44229]